MSIVYLFMGVQILVVLVGGAFMIRKIFGFFKKRSRKK